MPPECARPFGRVPGIGRPPAQVETDHLIRLGYGEIAENVSLRPNKTTEVACITAKTS